MKHMSFKVDNGIGWVKITNPPLNILNIEIMEEMAEIVGSINPAELKAVAISGEGKAFCAGVDVSDHIGDKLIPMMRIFKKLIYSILFIPIPAIAVVDGAALGGGMEVALACDFIIASEKAKFGQPEIKLGVFPPAAIAILPYKIGLGRATELILSGRIIGALEAREIGLTACSFPSEAFNESVENYLNIFREMSPSSLRITKSAIYKQHLYEIERTYEKVEEIYLNEMMKTHDAEEGLKSFLEKRKPDWRNE